MRSRALAKAWLHGYTVMIEPAASRKAAVQALVTWLLAQTKTS